MHVLCWYFLFPQYKLHKNTIMFLCVFYLTLATYPCRQFSLNPKMHHQVYYILKKTPNICKFCVPLISLSLRHYKNWVYVYPIPSFKPHFYQTYSNQHAHVWYTSLSIESTLYLSPSCPKHLYQQIITAHCVPSPFVYSTYAIYTPPKLNLKTNIQ